MRNFHFRWTSQNVTFVTLSLLRAGKTLRLQQLLESLDIAVKDPKNTNQQQSRRQRQDEPALREDASSPPNFPKEALTKSKQSAPSPRKDADAPPRPRPTGTRVSPCPPRTGTRGDHIPTTDIPAGHPTPGQGRPPPLPVPPDTPSSRPDPRRSGPGRLTGAPPTSPAPPRGHPRPPPGEVWGGTRHTAPYQKEVFAPLVGQPAPPGQSHGAGRLRGSTRGGVAVG